MMFYFTIAMASIFFCLQLAAEVVSPRNPKLADFCLVAWIVLGILAMSL